MPGGSPVSVVISVFEDLVLRGLVALVEEDESLCLVEGGVPPERLEEVLRERRPRVALVNFGTLVSPGALRTLHAGAPETRLVVMANHPSAAEARQMLAFGATACLTKSSESRDVVHAIHLASRGMHVLPSSVSSSEGAEPVAGAGDGPELLTAREANVLEGLQAGRSNGEIAADLHVSVETVRTHARNIYRKLGVGGRRELRTAR